MPDLSLAQQVCWNFSIFVRMLLLCLLFFRRNIRSFPFFSFYLLLNLSQALLVDFAYKVWGFSSPLSFWTAWGSEAIVVCARALAVAEIGRLVLVGYRGIWSLAWRLLFACAGLVLLYSFVVSQDQWDLAILGASRALELAIAAVIVVLFVFLRHYHVATEPTLRALALGFCLYSCVAVLNNTILAHWLEAYVPLWNLLGVLAFLACLLVWTWALRQPIPRPVLDSTLLPSSVYRQLSPEINLRLRLLNERLSQFWKVGARP